MLATYKVTRSNTSDSANNYTYYYCGCKHKLSMGISVLQRIVQRIGVAVKVLGEIRGLNIRVGTQEAAKERVIQPGVHVDETEPGEVLVTREATAEEEVRFIAGGVDGIACRIAQPAPWVITICIGLMPVGWETE